MPRRGGFVHGALQHPQLRLRREGRDEAQVGGGETGETPGLGGGLISSLGVRNTFSRSSSREVRIRVPTFSVL